MKYLVIYHKEDNDGVFSGAMFYNYLIHDLNIPANEIYKFGADYNDIKLLANAITPKNLHELYENIILTDISFSTEYMIELSNEFKEHFIWCDHHAPIIKSIKGYNNLIPGIRNTKKSAILCAYEWLYDPFNLQYNNKELPELLRILSAWDSFTFEQEGYELDYVRDVNKGITVKYDLNFKNISDLLHEIIYENKSSIDIQIYAHDFGHNINKYDDDKFEKIILTAGDKNWKINENRDACAIFHQGSSSSLIFKILKNTIYVNGIVFKHNSDTSWTISLYNINEDDKFNCGEYLREKYNGGGHIGAAGCTITQDQFIEILKNNKL